MTKICTFVFENAKKTKIIALSVQNYANNSYFYLNI